MIDAGITYLTKVRPGSSRLLGTRISNFEALVPYTATKRFTCALLNPNLTCRLTAENALSYAWLKSFASPTEHDFCGLREDFDPRSR